MLSGVGTANKSQWYLKRIAYGIIAMNVMQNPSVLQFVKSVAVNLVTLFICYFQRFFENGKRERKWSIQRHI